MAHKFTTVNLKGFNASGRKRPAQERHCARRTTEVRVAVFAMSMCVLLLVGLGVAHAGESAADLKAEGCGELQNPYGPFNYNTARGRKHWHVVESFHFTESVRTLQRGATGPIGQDLDYTLRAFPNQPLALYDMAIYQLQHGYPAGATRDTIGYYPAECYLKRAVVFAPRDGVVRMIYGIYLQRRGEYADALERYRQAEKRIPPARAGELYNNMGLLYLDMKNYGKAREYAKKAYDGGYPLSGLRDRLKAIHQWSPEKTGKN